MKKPILKTLMILLAILFPLIALNADVIWDAFVEAVIQVLIESTKF